MKGSFYLIIIISIAATDYFLYGKKTLHLTFGEDCYKSNEYKNFTVYQNITVGMVENNFIKCLTERVSKFFGGYVYVSYC